MFKWSLAFFFFALFAVVVGYGNFVEPAAGFAQVLFFIFTLLAAGSFAYGLIKKRKSHN